MNNIWTVIIYTFLAGVIGTVIGALVTMLFKLKGDKLLGIITSFASGFMLAIVCFDLIPEGLEYSNLTVVVAGVLIGILVIVTVNYAIKKPMEKYYGLHNHGDKDKAALTAESVSDAGYMRVGVMMIIAIGLHNLPEGMAIGSLGVGGDALSMAILIALHNIPEGIAMAGPLLKSGTKRWKTVFLVALSGLPTIIGGILGFLIGNLSTWVIGGCLAMAGGAMLFIIFQEMQGECYAMCKESEVGLGNILGLILGLILIKLI